jgi:hypothetical protein
MSELVGTTYTPPKNVLSIYNDKEFETNTDGTSVAATILVNEITEANVIQEAQIVANDAIYTSLFTGFPTFQSITPAYSGSATANNTSYTITTLAPSTRNRYCQLQGTIGPTSALIGVYLIIRAVADSTIFQTTVYPNYNAVPTSVMSFAKSFVLPPQTASTVISYFLYGPSNTTAIQFPPTTLVAPGLYGITTPLFTVLTL